MTQCCFCGPVRNCGPYLDKVLDNIRQLGELFDDYLIVLFYDTSNDHTLSVLKKHQQTNPRIRLFVHQQWVSKYRTHRLAHARNVCLQYIREHGGAEQYPFFAMMDFDDVNCKTVHPEVLQRYITHTDEWDALSF